MRPRILYDLSRHLAIVLERKLQGERREKSVPVYLCHPEDVESEEPGSREHAVGVLYLWRITPERRYRRAGVALARTRSSRLPEETGEIRRSAPWLRLRYVFLVIGGSLEDELCVLAAVIQALHDEPYVAVNELTEQLPPGSEEGLVAADLDVDALPVEFAAEPTDWRELGLQTHRRIVSFDVTVPLPASAPVPIPTILERDLHVEGSQPASD